MFRSIFRRSSAGVVGLCRGPAVLGLRRGPAVLGLRRGSAVLVGLGVAAAVLAGVVSPATAAGPLPMLTAACGGSMSSVTSCPANVMMLKEAGILAMPAAGGGTTGVVSSTAGYASTSGQAVGGALGLLAAVGSVFGITQLLDGGKLQSGSTLNTDGVGAQQLEVKTVPPGAAQSKDYSASIGQQSCVVAAPTQCSTIYTATATRFCVSANYSISGLLTKYYVSGSSGAVASPGSWPAGNPDAATQSAYGCPPPPSGTVKISFFTFDSAGNGTGSALNSWQAGTGAYTNAIPPVVTTGSAPGTVTKHVWCAPPGGGALVDVVTATAMSLQVGQKVNLAGASCPVGKTAVDSSVDWTPNGGSATAIVPRTNWAPGANPVIDAAVARPECANGSCLIVLTKITGDSCGTIGQLCPDWARDPNRTSSYQCKYGGTVVALDVCSVYRSPKDGVQPNTRADNTPYTASDPVVKPGGLTVTNPTVAPDPGTGLQPAPAPLPADAANPGADPQNCAPESWIAALNPFAVFTAVGCAIKNAFVPRTDVKARISQIATDVAGIPPFSWMTGVSFVAPGAASCPNWRIKVAGLDKNIVCDSSFTQAIVGSRGLIGTMLLSAMVWPLIRSLWYASIPFVRVSPSSSK